MDITRTLKKLFDFQNFAGNKRLQALIDETESRCLNSLSDDDLEWVSAAGEKTDPDEKKDGKEDD